MAAKTLPQVSLSDKPANTEESTGLDSGPDSEGLVRYLSTASEATLTNFELKWLGEEATCRDELVQLLNAMTGDRRRPGKINYYKHRARLVFNDMALARARVILCNWIIASRKTFHCVESSDHVHPKTEALRKKPGPKLLDSVFNAEADAYRGQGVLSYVEQHTSLLYYERHGCISCHTKNGAHSACGMCFSCYQLVRCRRKSIIEGRREQTRKPPKRFGVPSLRAIGLG